MPLKTRFLLATFLALLAVLLAILFTPLAVSNGVRLWLWWKARQEGFVVRIHRIEAPFLRPVVIRDIHVTSAGENAFLIDLTATQASVDLDLKRILLGIRGRAIRAISIQQLRGELRRNNRAGRVLTQGGWKKLHKLLPYNLSVASSDIRFEDGPTVILLRNSFLSAGEIETGRFSAGEIMIASPWFRQTFSDLRGATSWQDNRLTVAGLSLTRGLDLQSITADLSRLSSQRVGLEFDVDAFGGKIRASISNEWRSQRSNWKIAGSAIDISLAQTSDAIGFTDRIDGLLHACNFTFLGNLADPGQVIASLWTELTGLTWRNRTAEAIMLGAALYNRQVQLEQLYIKQKANQLTLSGEASFPSKSSDWVNPDFQGDVSTSINQLGDFAALFGANPGDFAGKITVDGTMSARNRKLGGHLTLDGASLTLFKTAIDTMTAKLNLKATELEIEQLDLKRKNDSLNAQGKVDMSHEHNYSGTLNVTVDSLTDYLSTFQRPAEANSQPIPTNMQITIDSSRWDARGVFRFPESSPLNFTANFLLPIGTDWNAFLESPLNVGLDFPSIFLARLPQLFHPGIFHDGILSGYLSLSGTLQHPHIIGDLQLVGGKIQNAPLNLIQGNGRITFSGDRAALDFLNVAAKDIDLSSHGEIDFHDPNDVAVRITTATPLFDLTLRQLECLSKIELQSVAVTLAPMIAELEVRGGLFRSNWTMTLRERTSTQSSTTSDLNETARAFPLCLGTSAQEEKTLLLGAPARSEARRTAVPSKKPPKRR